MSKARLDQITTVFKAEIDKNQLPGAVIGVVRKGQLVYFESLGYRDPVAKDAMPANAIFAIASMTKPMVSIAIMMLHDEGKLLLSDPVGKFLPALADMKVGVVRGRHAADRRRDPSAHGAGPAAPYLGLHLWRPRRHTGAQALAGIVGHLGHDADLAGLRGRAGQGAAPQRARHRVGLQPVGRCPRSDRRGGERQAARGIPAGAPVDAARHGRHGLQRSRGQEGPPRPGLRQRSAQRQAAIRPAGRRQAAQVRLRRRLRHVDRAGLPALRPDARQRRHAGRQAHHRQQDVGR